MEGLKKVLSYIKIYGVSRTLYKVAGRLRRVPKVLRFRNKDNAQKMSVGFIGCGQFSFATMSYYLRFSKKFYFKFAYDPDQRATNSFCEFNNIKCKLDSEDSVSMQQVDIVYIASNHHSHSTYAIDALNKGISAYIEKPIAVNWQQFSDVGSAIVNSKSDTFVGYNRPFSQAIRELSTYMKRGDEAFTLNCFVVGHFIGPEHWYRDPQEGTRVCGNLGHWIDLSIHLLFKKNRPEYIDVSVNFSDIRQSDDNITVVLTTNLGDLITLTLTSHSEPFEGINESISFHQSGIIADIQDFRRAVFWVGNKKFVRKYRPKDVGHKLAILQPLSKNKRDLEEVRISTALMLEVTDMVRKLEKEKRFLISDIRYEWK